MPKWQELTTYDRALHLMRNGHRDKWMPDKVSNHLIHTLVGAKRYAITDNACERIKEAVANYPELLFENSEFAIPPFEHMWIEFNARSLINHPVLSNAWNESTADRRIGYLFDHGIVSIWAEQDDLEPSPLFIAYQLHRPMPFPEQVAFAEAFSTSRAGLDAFLWGHTLSQYLDDEVKPGLRHRHSIVFPSIMSRFIGNDVLAGASRNAFYGSAGELRNILAVLLTINQPAKVLGTRAVPRQRGLIRGKPSPYFGHSVVDINIDRKSYARLLSPKTHGHHKTPRWHDVSGHFCHNREARTNRDHAHVWVEVDPRRWQCSRCEGRRWWRSFPNGRGSAQVGFVEQTRRIKTDADIRSTEENSVDND